MTTFTPYGSISLDASPALSIGKFTDSTSIAAETVRVYNAGAVEVFIGFGKSSGVNATAYVATKEETNSSFSIPPRESEILYKGVGNDQIAVITAGGLSPVRFTAVKTRNSGGDLMSSLELVSVLKDAMGNQKAINAAAEIIANAHNISNERRKEADAAAKVIADAKIATEELARNTEIHAKKVSEHRENIINFNSQVEEVRKNIETERAMVMAEKEKVISDISIEKAKIKTLWDDLAKREASVSAAESANIEASNALAKDIANHEIEKQKLSDAKIIHEEEAAKLAAKQKKLDDAFRS